MAEEKSGGGTGTLPRRAANKASQKPAEESNKPPAPSESVSNVPRKERFKEGVQTVSGRQRIKCYPVTLDQLENLAHVGWLAAALFSMATGSLVFSINLQTTLDLSTGVPTDITAFWDGINHGVFYGSLFLYALGIIAFFRGNKQKTRIMDNTIFPDD